MNDFPVETLDWLDVPIGVDGEAGFHWGDLHHVNRGITQEDLINVLATCSK